MLRLSNGERAALERLTRRFIARAGQPHRPEDLARLVKSARTTQLSLGEDNGDRTLRLDVCRELEAMHLITMTEDGTGAWCYLLPLGLGYGMGLLAAEPKRPTPAEAGAEPGPGKGMENRTGDETTTDEETRQEIAKLKLAAQDALAAQRLAELKLEKERTALNAARNTAMGYRAEAEEMIQRALGFIREAKQTRDEADKRYDKMVLRLTRELNDAWLDKLGRVIQAALKTVVSS